eukprot:SAG31_NODE_43216_length_268_cov_0.609467_1_plen_28_part_10
MSDCVAEGLSQYHDANSMNVSVRSVMQR